MISAAAANWSFGVGDKNMADKEDVEKTISEDLVVTKYKMAGDIVNRKFIVQ